MDIAQVLFDNKIDVVPQHAARTFVARLGAGHSQIGSPAQCGRLPPMLIGVPTFPHSCARNAISSPRITARGSRSQVTCSLSCSAGGQPEHSFARRTPMLQHVAQQSTTKVMTVVDLRLDQTLIASTLRLSGRNRPPAALVNRPVTSFILSAHNPIKASEAGVSRYEPADGSAATRRHQMPKRLTPGWNMPSSVAAGSLHSRGD